eukprot:COSAG06_NODE_708_length_12893_cov_10.008676_2_plen_36_part_00
MLSFYQDRLGTNLGKAALKKEVIDACFDLQGETLG